MTSKQHDADSDPSLDDGDSSDWSDEGGATSAGPATDPEDGSSQESEEQG